MPISAPGCCDAGAAMMAASARRRAQGFSLIEILIACAITAIVLATAAIRLDPADGRRLEAAAELLAGQLEAARDEAVMRGRPLAFSSDGDGYQFWLADAERDAWIALPASEALVSGRFAEGVGLAAMRINATPQALGQRLVFGYSGLAEPFVLTLASGSARLDIVGDALGRLEIRHAQ